MAMLVEKKKVDWQRALDFLVEAGVCFDGFKDSQAFWFLLLLNCKILSFLS